jgi:hypothetical protein
MKNPWFISSLSSGAKFEPGDPSALIMLLNVQGEAWLLVAIQRKYSTSPVFKTRPKTNSH